MPRELLEVPLPRLGKTLTAEAASERLRLPLYSVKDLVPYLVGSLPDSPSDLCR
jgi:hypothetical protein